jgi:acyl transferase domain-containing protein/acyl carrier protein
MTNAHSLDSSYDSALAIIGMAGRFSGAQDTAAFWQNLAGGVKSIRFFSDEELLAAGVSPDLLAQPNFVKAGSLLENVDRFDASFFGYTPREAELMDPQHRFFLECAWEAIEDAGYNTEQERGLVGIFAGASFSSYLIRNLYAHPNFLEKVGILQASIGSECDSLTSTVSYKLNLSGPCVTVQTFCSTSLVAVHLACQSLLNYECDMALAGGVAIEVPHVGGYLYNEGGIVSPDGECRTFDADARGSVMGNGAGVVLMKRLRDALDDGDHIYAVIRGSAINNDGSHRVSITAPGLDGQSEVIAEALGNAGIAAETIDYIEAHGTATELGDEVELAAMLKAFETQTGKKQFCAIGSVKPNIGHLDRAAGVTGLIKTALSLHHKQLPPSLNFNHTSQGINLAQSPFYVNTALQAWPQSDHPRRAGVNSFGLGGTNAHTILEEAPELEASSASRPWQLLLLSAKSEAALLQARTNLATYLQNHPDVPLADVAYTLQVGRNIFPQRAALLCRDHAEASKALADPTSTSVLNAREAFRDRPVAFLFPGLGEQYAGLAQELYRQEPVFREIVDQCCLSLQPLLHKDLREILSLTTTVQPGEAKAAGKAGAQQTNLRALLGRDGQQAAGLPTQLKGTEIAQPAIFVIEYALGKLLMHWGIQPQAMLGYSVGEYVAACLAGVLELEDALTLVAKRALLIQQQPAGAMLAVALSEREIQPYLNSQVSLAVINAPRTCVLAGPYPAIAAVETQLAERDIVCRRVETTHAFHSTMLEPLREELTALARSLTLHTPNIPYLSDVTGTWITDEQATDPAYWAQHMCQTVRFADGVEQLLQKKDLLLLEVGPGQALCSFVRQHPACERERMALAMSTQPARYEQGTAYSTLLHTLGKLWLSGVTLDWTGFYADERRHRISLPTYPFERQRYWINPPTADRQGNGASSGSSSTAGPNDDLERLTDLKDWFSVPSWKQVPLASDYRSSSLLDTPQCWLVFLDARELGKQLAHRLEEQGHYVVYARPGQSFARLNTNTYTLRPDIRADYDTLLAALAAQNHLPAQVVHLWTLDASENVTEALPYSLESLIALAQALGDQTTEHCQITIVTGEAQSVLGSEQINPAAALLTGPCRVIPQEYVSLSCRTIDILRSDIDTPELTTRLFAELVYETDETIVALRGGRRWAQHFEPVALAEQTPKSARLRQAGVYLITGGLGGIALAMAEHLARKYQAKLVLTTRQALPERSQWEKLLAADDQTSGVGRKIRQVLALEALGASVLIVNADVTDETQMRAAIEQTIATFGTLHGVLHAAGVPGSGLIQLKTAEQSAQILAPKVQGTLALARALRDQQLDFLALFSSMTSVTGGGPGQIDYCAANAFLDAYAFQPSQHGLTVSIDWGEWQWNGWETALSGYNIEAQEYFRAHRQQFGISFAEGAEALERILSTNLPQVVVSTQDFQIVAERSKQFTAAAVLQHTLESRQGRETHPRPTLVSPYVAPRSEMENKITAIWEDLLGVTPIGIDDSFFELGGNSLSGIDLIARLKKALDAPTLAAHVIYEAPTVSSLARYIEQGQTVMPVEEWQDRSEKRLAGLRQRVREAGKSL